MKRLRMTAAKIAERYSVITEKHGLLITIVVCFIVVFGSGLWVKLTPPTVDSAAVSDAPDIVDRLSDVMSLATFPPIATPSPTPIPGYTRPSQGDILRGYSTAPQYISTTDAYCVHAAVDILTLKGENILSPYNGKILELQKNARFGWVIVIKLSDESIVSIAGLDKPLVKLGDTVKQGQAIGVAGGIIPCESLDEPHIHIEYLCDRTQADISEKWD